MAQKKRKIVKNPKRRIVTGGRSDLAVAKKVIKKYTRKPKAGTKSVRKKTRKSDVKRRG